MEYREVLPCPCKWLPPPRSCQGLMEEQSIGSCIEMTAGVIQVGLQWFLFTLMSVTFISMPSHIANARGEKSCTLHDILPPAP